MKFKSEAKECDIATTSILLQMGVVCFAAAPQISANRVLRSSGRPRQICSITSCVQSSDNQSDIPRLSRRALLSLAAASMLATQASEVEAARNKEPSYDAIKTRRHVGIGRFPPDRPAPQFDPGKKRFEVDAGLEAQDVQEGRGDASVRSGSLVVARWTMVLEDGSTVDDSNENQPAMFRPGAHQVPPGIEDSVIGMRPGGVRRVSGTSERVLT